MAYTTIKKPSDYFNTILWSGNSSTNALTGVGFQPDWVWVKERSSISNHQTYDAVRGTTKQLEPNTSGAEGTISTGITSFDTDGFTVGNNSDLNSSGETYVGWNWLGANGTASNTDGSITSTVSANTTSGFSIVKYTGNFTAGAQVGHGLGVVPKMIILKEYSQANDWVVYHNSLGNNKKVILNETNAESTDSFLNNTTPTSSYFTLGAQNVTNRNGSTYIAYCFAEKKGFSKFGSYVGNGNADGTFVYTGFKPSFVMHKRTDTTNNWIIQDNKRVGYNADNRILKANLSDAEQGVHEMDFVSNGFKIRTTGAGSNASGGTYIYMAFADEPLVGDNPATAR